MIIRTNTVACKPEEEAGMNFRLRVRFRSIQIAIAYQSKDNDDLQGRHEIRSNENALKLENGNDNLSGFTESRHTSIAN